MEDLKGMLQHRAELIEEALYFVNALENEDYACDEDRQKLEKELEEILKELNIEPNNDE
jgi:hypothetical protein|tara:strand:- start:32 stop:208 length:177 start_codon:yes stop_codon:yes gene_type:complete